MLSESQKRRASLSILEKLRGKGMPEREPADNGEFDSMFATVTEEGKVESGKAKSPEPEKKPLPDIELEDDTAIPPIPSSGSVSRRKPAANQAGAKAFMKAFKGVK
jgi:hypothetical protein